MANNLTSKAVLSSIPEMTRKDVVIEKRDVVFQGFFRMELLTIRHRCFSSGSFSLEPSSSAIHDSANPVTSDQWMGPFTRELFERGEAVCVLLFDPKRNCVVLTEQFRMGALEDDRSPWLLEVVAGMVEPNESYQDVATRECQEEAGCTPSTLLPICHYWVSPGGTNERVMLYCGLVDSAGLDGVHGLPEEHEDIRLVTLSCEDAFQAVTDG
ncbi:MAG: NUDIX domain-containing protein, partial [Oleibacter sp.]|nr:NUDIX domain-containing protein [Thalassolituus sp.]